MEENERDLTAYCGLYCGDCIRYKCRASDLADELLIEIEERHFAEYAKVKSRKIAEFKNMDSAIRTLKAIAALRCEIPCRLGGDGCGGSCEIARCVKNRAIEGCWECDGFETCEKFQDLRAFHGDGPRMNLEKIRQYGLGSWAKHREKCYPWL